MQVDLSPKETIKLFEERRPELLDKNLFDLFPGVDGEQFKEVDKTPFTAVEYSSWDGSKLDLSFSDKHNWDGNGKYLLEK